MERLEDILLRLMQEEDLFAQIFSTEDEDGTQHFFNVAKGLRIARESGDLRLVSLAESGITADVLRDDYTNLNEAYAMTTDTSRPILFVPHKGRDLCIDGYHRLFRAAVIGQEEIPAYFLTEEQAKAIRIITLPPDQGINWGQRRKVA